jgi:hypothetical protein
MNSYLEQYDRDDKGVQGQPGKTLIHPFALPPVSIVKPRKTNVEAMNFNMDTFYSR